MISVMWTKSDFLPDKSLDGPCRIMTAHHLDPKKTKFDLLSLLHATPAEKKRRHSWSLRSHAGHAHFGNKPVTGLGIDHHHNYKVWINRDLIFARLKSFKKYITIQNGRHALLLFDTCAAHGQKDDLLSFNHVCVELFSSRTTRETQTPDVCIILWAKNKYRRRLLIGIFDNIHSGRKSIDSADILTTMRWDFRKWRRARRQR